MSALHNYVRNNNERILERILQGALRQIQKEHPDSTVLDPSFIDKKDVHGRTALHIAAYQGEACTFGITHSEGKLSIAKLLLRYGASPQAVAQDSTTPLHFAAQQGHRELALELCRKGAGPNVKTARAWMTPLHLALSKGHADVAFELVKRGAIQKYNSKGQLPLELASDEALSRLCELLGDERFKRLKEDIRDKPKTIKPPVPFYNRKRKQKNPEGEGPTHSKQRTKEESQGAD